MPTARQTSFGEAARIRRLALGLSQAQVAERAQGGVDQALISKIEKNRISDPGVSIAHSLARALDCTVEELMSGEGPRLPVPVAPTADAIVALQEQLEKVAATARTALALAERHEAQLSRRRKSVAAS